MQQQPLRNPYLCITIVWLLGVVTMTSLLGIIIINLAGKEPHSSLISLASGGMCGLTAFLVQPPRHSVGYDEPYAAPGPQPPPIVISPNQAEPHVQPRPTLQSQVEHKEVSR